ncbi:fis family transcriptional regulator : Transcriptional regulator, NifA subfamily, Fis Family OS=Rhodopirellula sp. SWK7 GN=RRSWK_02475 PE=4 SV=1: Sigma54_activat: HTH_8 [Gemmataceae bacterium]|nr:fis family transcriptional regulator : Transcriptional regulator, NifA subfamily, Fis Family OS=Rhodopirellula sp. SWK7 GN=RRSWK_02475 PE=4 SV=1: Sigma54_activat: HTH_8 [Gemmataceae bacterium]VTT98527.1 fis family transcriptional regulator : Transcriptional regulator, NifA subfamily, Fis Family OS=Rhodopirellula sp. SWK7 GN=RRSWK_02475 PE=4 SV=1: Sigma54_activat: HTH_8 [Gemmataceae bacterium]
MPAELLLGCGPAIEAVRRAVARVGPTDATVLIHGETGTGKELVARAVHASSRRRGGAFVATNCGAFVPGLAAGELFGHAAGAFTGALKPRRGKFEAAHGGTLFLDEVGELPPDLQPLLLRVLQERVVEPVGGDPVQVNVRVVAATNRDLAADVASGRFRADLFYRLNVFPVRVPPLRERAGDVPELAGHFLREFAAAHDRPARELSGAALRLLAAHDWPGNVRELRNVIERAVILSTGPDVAVPQEWLGGSTVATGRTWAAQEKARILDALRAAGGRVYGPGGAAQRLGLRPTTLYGKMRKHGLSKDAASWQ